MTIFQLFNAFSWVYFPHNYITTISSYNKFFNHWKATRVHLKYSSFITHNSYTIVLIVVKGVDTLAWGTIPNFRSSILRSSYNVFSSWRKLAFIYLMKEIIPNNFMEFIQWKTNRFFKNTTLDYFYPVNLTYLLIVSI